MPAPIREQVILAVEALLKTTTLASGPVKVFRNARGVEDGETPALVLLEGTQDEGAAGVALTRYSALLDVEGYVETRLDAELGPAINDLYAATVKAVMADYTLGGLIQDITEVGCTWGQDRTAGLPANCHFILTLGVRYETKFADPYQFAI